MPSDGASIDALGPAECRIVPKHPDIRAMLARPDQHAPLTRDRDDPAHHALPAAFQVEQGEAVGRPCLLRLSVSSNGEISVGGRVVELGRGVINV